MFQKCILKTIVLFYLAFIAFSCTNQKSNARVDAIKEDFSNLDTTQIMNIENAVNIINAAVQEQGYPQQIPFPHYNPLDTIKYWSLDGKPSRVQVYLKFADKKIWPTFFVHNGELIMVRYRLWSHEKDQYALENLSYIQKGEIIYCLERKMELQPGDEPVLLRDTEFSACKRSTQEIERDYHEYWIAIKDFLDKNI